MIGIREGHIEERTYNSNSNNLNPEFFNEERMAVYGRVIPQFGLNVQESIVAFFRPRRGGHIDQRYYEAIMAAEQEFLPGTRNELGLRLRAQRVYC